MQFKLLLSYIRNVSWLDSFLILFNIYKYMSFVQCLECTKGFFPLILMCTVSWGEGVVAGVGVRIGVGVGVVVTDSCVYHQECEGVTWRSNILLVTCLDRLSTVLLLPPCEWLYFLIPFNTTNPTSFIEPLYLTFTFTFIIRYSTFNFLFHPLILNFIVLRLISFAYLKK